MTASRVRRVTLTGRNTHTHEQKPPFSLLPLTNTWKKETQRPVIPHPYTERNPRKQNESKERISDNEFFACLLFFKQIGI